MKEIFYISNILAAFNSFGLFGLLFFRKKNSLPNFALSVILFIPALFFVNSILMLSGKQTGSSPYFFFLAQTIGAFFPSAVCFFTYALLGKKLKKLNFVFITSAIIGLLPITYFIDFLNLTLFEKNLFFEKLTSGEYPNSVEFYNIVFYTFQQFVFAWLIKMCYNFKRKSKNVLSSISSTKVYYLQSFLWTFFSLNIFLLIASLLFDVLIVEYLILPISLIFLHSFTIYYGFKNAVILSKEEYENNSSKNKVIENNFIIKHNLSTDELSQLEERIINELNHNSIYKNSEISLAKMAEIINIPAYKITITLNEKMNTTFYDIINSTRIEASLELLQKNDLFTIESIALEVGFKSKSTFYRAFKKHTGVTPLQYISNC